MAKKSSKQHGDWRERVRTEPLRFTNGYDEGESVTEHRGSSQNPQARIEFLQTGIIPPGRGKTTPDRTANDLRHICLRRPPESDLPSQVVPVVRVLGPASAEELRAKTVFKQIARVLLFRQFPMTAPCLAPREPRHQACRKP